MWTLILYSVVARVFFRIPLNGHVEGPDEIQSHRCSTERLFHNLCVTVQKAQSPYNCFLALGAMILKCWLDLRDVIVLDLLLVKGRSRLVSHRAGRHGAITDVEEMQALKIPSFSLCRFLAIETLISAMQDCNPFTGSMFIPISLIFNDK